MKWRLALVGLALVLAVAVVGIVPAASLAAAPTPEWTKQSPATSPPAHADASMAYDPATGKMVLFGGGTAGGLSNETWTYNGSTWTQQSPGTSPPARQEASMAYDPASGEMVLFGGGTASGNYSNETWTYNGSTWTQQSPATSPPRRQAASMAFDPATGAMVLFGGFTESGGFSNETWTYNGSTWTQQSPATSPSARFDPSMAFDPASGEMVLFGGDTAGGLSNETWTYDGTTWTEQSPATSPSARFDASMAYDPASGEMALFGGLSSSTLSNETWTYDGTTWTEQSPATTPSARGEASMAYDPASGKMVLFGGATASGISNETWTYGLPPGTANEWTKQSPATSPAAREAASMAYDPASGEMVLFGGFTGGTISNETWTYDGSTWAKQSSTPSLSGRGSASMAYDPASGKMVLFGGSRGSELSNETWTYDGSAWTYQTSGPSAREAASMAYDPASGKMVLFGGGTAGGLSNETWTYNGSTWTNQSPAGPSARYGATIAYDPATGKMVLFGGGTAGGLSNETWTYDGSTWTKQSPTPSPSARLDASMAFDPASGEMVLFGGYTESGSISNETWTYDGSTWTKQSPTPSPSARYLASMAFDPASGEMVLFGGHTGSGRSNETWTYGPVDGAPTATIASPGDNQSYTFEESAPTSFSCAEGTGGPGIESCEDSNGSASPGQLDTSTVGPHTYTVTATSKDGLTGTASIEYTVTKADQTLDFPVIPNKTFGSPDFDPGASASSGLAVTYSSQSEAVCTIEAGEIHIVGAGRCEVTAEQEGDADYNAAAPVQQSFQVAKATPTISTTASGATIGGQIIDESTVSGRFEPSGDDQVEFKVYGPDDSGCKNGVIEAIISPALPGEHAVSSAAYAPTEAGAYHWIVEYTGDANNEAVESPCEASGETSIVSKATPTLSTIASRATLGGAIHDEATVEGRVDAQAEAEVEFKLYPPSDPTCVQPPVYTNSVSYAASGEPTVSSGPYTTTEAGTYHWTAIYSGDVNNEGAESVCEAAHALPNEVLVGSIDSSEVQPIDIATNTDRSPITVGSKPEQLAVSPDQGTAYVANHASNTVSVIDTTTNAVTATITGFSAPEGVAFDPAGGVAYVANSASNTVSVINTTTNAVTATIPVGSNPWQIAFTPDGSTAYVTNSDDDTVSVIDVSSGTVTATIPGFDNPKGVVVTPDGRTVYVANDFGSSSEQGTVTPIATATNAAGSPIAVPANPIALAATPDGSEALVANHFGGSPNGSTITPIDTADNTPGAPYIPCFNYGNFGTPLGIAVTPDGQTIYTDNLNNYTACYDSVASPTPTAANSTYANSPAGVAIAAPLQIGNAATLPAPTVETSYSQALWSVNGTYPMTYSVASGPLPPGVSLSSSGVLSGTPTAAGSYSFTVQSSDSSSAQQSAAKAFDLEVKKAEPTISTTPDGPVTVGATIEDEAKVEGRVDPQAGSSVEFKLYPPSDATCSHTPVYTHTASYAATGEPSVSSGTYATTEAGTYHWSGIYSGDANNQSASSICTEASAAVKASPTLSTTASSGITLGGATKVKDTATLTNGYSPGGTVTFKLYGPNDTSCTGGIAFQDTETVSGAGAVSAELAPTAAGTYRWTAEYNGDANNNGATDACNGANESVAVAKAAPTIMSTATGPVTVGAKVKDTATLAGGATPGGTITFKLYGPGDSGCHNAAVSDSGPITVTGNGNYESGEYPTTAAGAYYWTVEYSGDANNSAATSACEASGETSNVDKAAPTFSTTASPGITLGGATKVKDTATLSGGYSPGGTVTFKLYGPGDSSCTGGIAFQDTETVSGANAESAEFAPTAAGTYRWTAEYSGDANNSSATEACNGANESVAVDKAAPTISTAPGGPVTVGATIEDQAKVEGRVDPQAGSTVEFKLYPPSDAT
ncbi:MAG TPA: kelch repeat-containing protein, partial [Solirubrobacterales bacterium]|nr:kelch repeat-containing protein [Solirubrobacterales bacterium]